MKMKMKLKDLKVGDVVYIREDLESGAIYCDRMYVYGMSNGVKQIKNIYSDKSFSVVGGNCYLYTPEMIDWEKTMNLKDIQAKEYLNKKFGSDKVHNPSHYGGGGKHNIECYKAIEYILDNLKNVPEKYYGHVSNVIKYIWRCNDKNGYEDLDKASVYFDFMFREKE